MHKIVFKATLVIVTIFLVGCVQKSAPVVKARETSVTRTEIDNLNKEIESTINEADNTIDEISGTENRSKIVKNSALLDKCVRVLAYIAIYNLARRRGNH